MGARVGIRVKDSGSEALLYPAPAFRTHVVCWTPSCSETEPPWTLPCARLSATSGSQAPELKNQQELPLPTKPKPNSWRPSALVFLSGLCSL